MKHDDLHKEIPWLFRPIRTIDLLAIYLGWQLAQAIL